ncbi:MAG: hypothetical protein U0M12_02470 [Acutalibacteraceae bacterium]|nr:hypothetical protein [Acutalibacteraceae bacterium]
MSIFDCYFNHKVGVRKRISIDSLGNTTYHPPIGSPPIEISCRIEHKFKEILDKDGNKITSEAKLFTNTKLNPLDMVVTTDGKRYTVKSCKPIDNIAGELDHYEVYL